MANRAFSGSVELSAPMHLAADCLGETIAGQIADATFTLTFPTPGGEASPLNAPEFHEPYWLEQDDGDPRFWGLDFGSAGCMVCGVAALVQTRAVPPDCPSDVARGICSRRLRARLQHVAGRREHVPRTMGRPGSCCDLRGSHRGAAVPIVRPRKRHRRDGAARRRGHHRSRRHLGDDRPVQISDWRSAANLVSAGTPPDQAWGLFRRACRFGRDDPRAAAIDACAAAEIALGRRIIESLDGHPDDAKELIIQNTGGLIGLVSLADRLFGKPDKALGRPDYSNDLAKVRISAAHQGKVPSLDEVDNALKTAKWLLGHHLPLPEPTEA